MFAKLGWIPVGILLGTIVGFGITQADPVPKFDEPHDRPQTEQTGFCTVDVGPGRLTPGNRCYYRDEVVTGSQSGYLLCSQVRVICQ